MSLTSILKDYFEELLSDRQDTLLKQIANWITVNGILLKTVIIELETYLTSIDDKIRNRSTSLVSFLLRSNCEFILSNTDVQHLTKFFISRLGDYPSINPSLQGLHALSKYHSYALPNDIGIYRNEVIIQVTTELHTQSLAQSIRQNTFSLFHSLLNLSQVKLPDNMMKSSSSVISSSNLSLENETMEMNAIILSLEGEKDPRCLILGLDILLKMMQIYSPTIIHDKAEKIFDNIICYFPITFNPPPDDPIGIKPAALITALENALCFHPAIVEYTIPIMIDKLYGDSDIARNHALSCLERICKLHSLSKQMESQLERLSDVLFELATNTNTTTSDPSTLHGTSMTTQVRAKNTIAEISYAILKKGEASIGSTLWELFVLPIVKKTIKELEHSFDSILSTHCVNIICAMIMKSYDIANSIVPIILPLCLKKIKQLREDGIVRVTQSMLTGKEYQQVINSSKFFVFERIVFALLANSFYDIDIISVSRTHLHSCVYSSLY